MPIVYSTLSTDVIYPVYFSTPSGHNEIEREVKIKGGANVAQGEGLGSSIYTPRGVATTITDQELEILEKNTVFKIHKKNGFITVDSGNKEAKNIDEVVKNMEKRDRSAPLTPGDYKNSDLPKPSVSTFKK